MRPRRFFAAASQQASLLASRIVTRLERERRWQLVLVLSVSVVCAALVVDAVVAVRGEKAAWTRDTSVLVLTRDVKKGDALTALNTRTQRIPGALAPADALADISAHITARVSMRANTPLSLSLIVLPADAVTVPAGWRVIALPPDLALPVVDPGDTVDVVVGDAVVAEGAVVVSLEPFSVAVPVGVIARVAAAARVGEVTVVSLA